MWYQHMGHDVYLFLGFSIGVLASATFAWAIDKMKGW
jgi:hypothetical protein